MFYYVNGTVTELEAGLAVIDCGGVGYACATTNYTLSQLKKGERAKLYTYLNVREDAMELFGFASQSELRSFKMLIGVSGVGPKAALSILSSTTPQQLAMAVVMGDEKALTAAPGIGKKIAQRIILELKDKLAKEQGSFDAGSSGSVRMPTQDNKAGEAAAALAVLGYGSQEIAAALKGIEIFEREDYMSKIARIEAISQREMLGFTDPRIREVRVMGGCTCVEVYDEATLEGFQQFAYERGVFSRPFLKYMYSMVPYVIEEDELVQIFTVMKDWFRRG